MSAYTTIDLTRKEAEEMFASRFLSKISNDELENLLDKALDKELYNVNIVSEDFEIK